MGSQQVLSIARSGLIPADREAINVKEEVPRCNTRYAITVNIEHQSSSPNFRTLTALAPLAASGALVRVSFRIKTETFACYLGIPFPETPRSLKATLLVPFRSAVREATTENYVAGSGGVVGQTLFPMSSRPQDDIWYGTTGYVEIYIARDQNPAEQAITLFHELRAHAIRFLQGQPFGHGNVSVDNIAEDAERETRRNTTR